jgi:serralysin
MYRDLAHTRFSGFGLDSTALSHWDVEDALSLDFGEASVANWCAVLRPETTAYKGLDALLTGGTTAAPTLPPPPTPPTILTDVQPGDITTPTTLTVDGPSVVATINTIGDQDYFRVHLEQGQYYEIGQFLKVGGPNGIPLADAYVELYNAQGTLITSADGGGGDTPSGLDALLTYQAQYTGDYYINARAFDNDATNGTGGDFVGDYEVFVHSIDPQDANVYVPRYSPDQPMHSIDWGTQIDRTSRNPDGDNGPRDNGAEAHGVTYNAQFNIEGKNVITYYFAKTGDIFLDSNPATPGSTDNMVAKGFVDWEKDAFRDALDQYEHVTDNVYIEVATREEADFKFVTYNGTPGVGASLLGRMSPPNEENEGQAEFNAGDVRWTQEGVSQGGFYFPTLLHELGHGHGMAHPHDNGGRSSIMPGADGGTGGLGGGFGDWGLSQQVFTIMSYNDGWNEEAPYGARPVGHGGPSAGGLTGTEADHYGWVGTLSALDIAVLQDKYGVNEDYATGNDVYTIADENGPGKFYSTIWDAAGTDEIKYVGARNANIDLRAATLKYEEGGGGWVSYAMGAWNGFTIANGVTIENATGGAGDDILIGNDATNTLSGGAGVDAISAGAGLDVLLGNEGNDVLDGQAGQDYMAGGLGDDVFHVDDSGDNVAEAAGEGNDTVYASVSYAVTENVEHLYLTDSAPYGVGNAQDNHIVGNDAFNELQGHGGNDKLYGGGEFDLVYGNDGNDELYGEAGADALVGDAGNDRLDGGIDQDYMIGGAGDDAFYVENIGDNAVESAGGGNDTIYASTAYTITENVENLVLTGTARYANGNNADNTITGNAEKNELRGLGGADQLVGGGGSDLMWGGAGADTFVYTSASESTRGQTMDAILDFQVGIDHIDLSAVHTGANDSFSFSQINGNTFLHVDLGGNGTEDMMINLYGVTGVTNADVIW